MRFGMMAAAAALVAATPATAATVVETLTFAPNSYSFDSQSGNVNVYRTGQYFRTVIAGEIADGYATGTSVQFIYLRRGLTDLVGLDLRGTGQALLEYFDKSGQSEPTQPGTVINLTDAFQTFTFDPSPQGFLFRLTSSTPFDVDNATFNVSTAVPEPASWMLMIGGFALAGGAARRRQRLDAKISMTLPFQGAA